MGLLQQPLLLAMLPLLPLLLLLLLVHFSDVFSKAANNASQGGPLAMIVVAAALATSIVTTFISRLLRLCCCRGVGWLSCTLQTVRTALPLIFLYREHQSSATVSSC